MKTTKIIKFKIPIAQRIRINEFNALLLAAKYCEFLFDTRPLAAG
jgi:hypothetical protein